MDISTRVRLVDVVELINVDVSNQISESLRSYNIQDTNLRNKDIQRFLLHFFIENVLTCISMCWSPVVFCIHDMTRICIPCMSYEHPELVGFFNKLVKKLTRLLHLRVVHVSAPLPSVVGHYQCEDCRNEMKRILNASLSSCSESFSLDKFRAFAIKQGLTSITTERLNNINNKFKIFQ